MEYAMSALSKKFEQEAPVDTAIAPLSGLLNGMPDVSSPLPGMAEAFAIGHLSKVPQEMTALPGMAEQAANLAAFAAGQAATSNHPPSRPPASYQQQIMNIAALLKQPSAPVTKAGPLPTLSSNSTQEQSLFDKLSGMNAGFGFNYHKDDKNPGWVPFGGIHPDIEEFCEHFKIDERGMTRLNECMTQRRKDTWDDDLARLWEDCEGCQRNPTALVMKKVSDMYAGTFVGILQGKNPEVIAIGKKYKLDVEAKRRLEEALMKRDEAERKQILADMDLHLAATSNTSKCVMRLLSFLMKGNPMPAPPKPSDEKEEKDKQDILDVKRGDDRGKGSSRSSDDRSRGDSRRSWDDRNSRGRDDKRSWNDSKSGSWDDRDRRSRDDKYEERGSRNQDRNRSRSRYRSRSRKRSRSRNRSRSRGNHASHSRGGGSW